MKELSNILREAMARKGIRAVDLCKTTKIPKGLMSYYLNGKVLPKQDKLISICEALDLDPDTVTSQTPIKANGKSHTRLWSIWHGMKQRCGDRNHDSFKYYGLRGISVCEEWVDSFLKFYEWSMANGYQDNLTLDRIDPNGNYTPANCRWVTWDVQARNKRKETE